MNSSPHMSYCAIQESRLVKAGTFVLTVLLFAGCASYKLDDAQHNLRSSFAHSNYEKTVALLEKYQRKGVYREKDRVLFNLEMGMASHFNGRYNSSTVYFSRAEEDIDQLFSRSISRGITAFLLGNDNTLAYNGEEYEDIYLNAFKSLNFIQKGNFESALVEARRMAYKLSQLEIKYEGLASALSKADTLKKAEWKAGKTNLQNSAFSHYLSTLLYAKSGYPDDARIEYEKLIQAFEDQPGIYSFKQPDRRDMRRITDARSYNVLLTAFAGRAPIKRQNDVRLYLDEEDLYLKFSLPSLHLYRSMVHRVQVVIDDTLKAPVHLIEEMDVVSAEVYKVKEPIIYARGFARSFAKAVGSNMISDAIKKENKDLGFLANIFGKIGQEISEKADLRGWQTMPGKAYANVIKLPPGSHTLRMQYYDASGRLLFSQEKIVEIKTASAGNLELFETLYWN